MSSHQIIIFDVCKEPLLLGKDNSCLVCLDCASLCHRNCRPNYKCKCTIGLSHSRVHPVRLDLKENYEYLMMKNENRRLVEENEKLISETRQELSEEKEKLDKDNCRISKENEKLINENKDILKHNEMLEMEKQELFNGNEYLRKENCELRKRMITAEVKLIKSSNPDLLEERYARLEWSDLTPAFQEELMGKLRSSCGSSIKLDKVLSFNSKALMRLIKAGEGDEGLLNNIIEDCLSNGKVDWNDLDNSFCTDLLSKLRESSEVSGLELNHVPLSSNVLLHMLNNQTRNNPEFLGELVTTYISGAVDGCQKMSTDLFKLALVELINDSNQIIDGLELPVSDLLSQKTLIKLGVLKNRKDELIAPFQFVHDSVRHYVIGTMIRWVMQGAKISRMNALRLFYKGYMSVDQLSNYFADFICERQPNFTEVNYIVVADLLMILSILNLPTLEGVTTVIKYLKTLHPERNLVDIEYSRKNQELTITLLHAAAIKGNLNLVRCLLNDFGFSKELGNSRFRNLILACVENTKGATSDQVQQRKEIINDLLQLNGNLIKCDTPNVSLNVHDHLIKFMVGKGADSWFDLVSSPATMVKMDE